MTAIFPSSAAITDPPVSAKIGLKNILSTLPRECFQKDPRKAWTGALFSVLMAVIGYVAIATVPTFLLPIAWFFTGTALTGWFVIAHDCGHRSFAQRKWVNNLVGHIFMLPLIYPFHSWRIMHNWHHTHTNKMDTDNAWQPLRPEEYQALNGLLQWGYRQMRGWFWWLASIMHWVGLHFDWRRFSGKEREQVRQSVLLVLVVGAIALPLMVVTLGPWSLVKFWLMPWLVYHFWMSTFTLVHHTAPGIAFREPEGWDAAQAQLAGTVHCEYPAWVEAFCHHINVHVPHHLSTAIPSYNLRMAHASLRDNWEPYLRESRFSWELMKQIATECHLYHPEQAYESFRSFHQRTEQ